MNEWYIKVVISFICLNDGKKSGKTSEIQLNTTIFRLVFRGILSSLTLLGFFFFFKLSGFMCIQFVFIDNSTEGLDIIFGES